MFDLMNIDIVIQAIILVGLFAFVSPIWDWLWTGPRKWLRRVNDSRSDSK